MFAYFHNPFTGVLSVLVHSWWFCTAASSACCLFITQLIVWFKIKSDSELGSVTLDLHLAAHSCGLFSETGLHKCVFPHCLDQYVQHFSAFFVQLSANLRFNLICKINYWILKTRINTAKRDKCVCMLSQSCRIVIALFTITVQYDSMIHFTFTDLDCKWFEHIHSHEFSVILRSLFY